MTDIQYHIGEIIKKLGENLNREGIRDTPKRIENMYKEIFSGYYEDPPKITSFDEETPSGLIIDSGYFFSICEHHMIPFFGYYYFGYIPNKYYIGASKIGRTVDHFSAKMQTAERLTNEIINYITSNVEPKGSILLMNGRHLCKEMRGLKKWNSPFEVIEAKGILLNNTDGCKDEFISRLSKRM